MGLGILPIISQLGTSCQKTTPTQAQKCDLLNRSSGHITNAFPATQNPMTSSLSCLQVKASAGCSLCQVLRNSEATVMATMGFSSNSVRE